MKHCYLWLLTVLGCCFQCLDLRDCFYLPIPFKWKIPQASLTVQNIPVRCIFNGLTISHHKQGSLLGWDIVMGVIWQCLLTSIPIHLTHCVPQTLTHLSKIAHAKDSLQVSQVCKCLPNWALRELNTAPSGPHQYCRYVRQRESPRSEVTTFSSPGAEHFMQGCLTSAGSGNSSPKACHFQLNFIPV